MPKDGVGNISREQKGHNGRFVRDKVYSTKTGSKGGAKGRRIRKSTSSESH